MNELEFLKRLKEVLLHSKIGSTMLDDRIKEVEVSLEKNEEEKIMEGCGKKLNPVSNVIIKCGEYVMSWDRVEYCSECSEKFAKSKKLEKRRPTTRRRIAR